MTYAQAIKFLYDLRFFGAKLGLDRAFKLAALAGNPQNQLSFIHVAGTNGKGSTCAMIESIYRASGLRVGLYTSPHLVFFGERIQINRQPISESDITRLVSQTKILLADPPWSHPAEMIAKSDCSEVNKSDSPDQPARTSDLGLPTFFEAVTVMALRYFAEQNCKLVIWETGMGGRLDATNIVTPLASVITNVQLDHQSWLGETLPQIAAEKAGIIKPRIPVITAATEPLALRVLQERARQLHSPLTIVDEIETRRPPLSAIELPLRGQHQRLNAALALTVARVLSSKIPVSEEAIHQGLATVDWPGRFQIIRTDDARTIILDGAHNPAGIATLRATLKQYFPGQKPAFVFGVLRDKDYASMCRLLAPLADRLCLTPVSSERTADPEVLRRICKEADPAVRIEVFSSLSETLKNVRNDSLVVVTGSLHFIGEAMELLQISPSPASNERGLNEWTANPREA